MESGPIIAIVGDGTTKVHKGVDIGKWGGLHLEPSLLRLKDEALLLATLCFLLVLEAFCFVAVSLVVGVVDLKATAVAAVGRAIDVVRENLDGVLLVPVEEVLA